MVQQHVLHKRGTDGEWVCSCISGSGSGRRPPPCGRPAAMVVFIYAEADQALLHGFPFASSSSSSSSSSSEQVQPAQMGPMRWEEAERRREDDLRMHRHLLAHVRHAQQEEEVEETRIAYARRVLRFPIGPLTNAASDECSMAHQHDDRNVDDDRDDCEDHDEQDDEGEELVLYVREDHRIVPHGQVWEGSIAMARWICGQYPSLFECSHDERPTFLELGSGCGLPGLVLAALGAKVTLSDRSKGALENLQHNIQINMSIFKGCPPAVVRLDWSRPASMAAVWPMNATSLSPLRSFDFVVGTEVVYSKEGAEQLIPTIKVWLRQPSSDAPEGTAQPMYDGGTFLLLQNRLRAGLQHFVNIIKMPHNVDEATAEKGRGLQMEELEFTASSEGDDSDTDVRELRLYQVRCTAELSQVVQGKPSDLTLDSTLERLTAETTWHQVGLGCSRAAVYRLERRCSVATAWAYLKVNLPGTLAVDATVMRLFERCGIPAPRVLHYQQDPKHDVLLMSVLEGITGADPPSLAMPRALAVSYARGLRMIHDNPSLCSTEDQRLDMRLAARLAKKELAAAFGNFRQERLEAARRHLANAPKDAESDIVFTHGDYCLPNVIFRIVNQPGREEDNECDVGGGVSGVRSELEVVGFIDLGEAGIADRYRDLACAVWSLRFNGLGDHVGTFLHAYTASPHAVHTSHNRRIEETRRSGEEEDDEPSAIHEESRGIRINWDKLNWYLALFELT